MSDLSAEHSEARTTVAEALSHWESRGSTSLTVALVVDALYGAAERIAEAEAICSRVEANPTGWGGAMSVSLARTIATALSPDSNVVPDSCTHGLNHAPLPEGTRLSPGFCAGCDEERDDAGVAR